MTTWKVVPCIISMKSGKQPPDFYFLSLFSNIVMCQNIINITAITIPGIIDRVATSYNFLCTHQLETGFKNLSLSKLCSSCFFFFFIKFSKCVSDVISDVTMTLNAYCYIAVLDVCVCEEKMEWLRSPLASLLPFSVSYRLYICKSYVNWKLSQQAIQDFVLCSVFPLYLIGLTSLHKHHVWTQWQKSLTKQHSSEAFNGTFSVQSIMKIPPFFWLGLS